MHTYVMTGGDFEDTSFHKNCPKAMDLDNIDDSDSHGPDHTVDSFPGATLIERVLRFLKSYDKSRGNSG